MTYQGLKRKTDKIILILIIILMSGASFLNEQDAVLIAIFFFLATLMIIQKKKLDNFMVGICLLWLVINISSFLYNNTSFPFNTFIGYIIRLMIPYFALKLIGSSFWEKLEKIIFKLAIITLPIFTLNIIFPDFFHSLKPIFEPLTSEVFYQKETQSNYWYSFFYTHIGRGDIRNSGFMWEPGAFAMVMVLMIIYNWSAKGFYFSRKIFIYSLLILTTLSTAGYLSLTILFSAFFLKTRKLHISVFAGILITLFFLYSNSLDFIGPKIDSFLNDTQKNIIYEQGYGDRYEANRISYFLINFSKSLNLPTGYGVVEDVESFFAVQKVVGVNGLGDILLMWGWVGLFFVVVSIYRFCLKIGYSRISTGGKILFSFAILIVFFSNPIERNPILFLIIFTPYIFKHKVYVLNQRNAPSIVNLKYIFN